MGWTHSNGLTIHTPISIKSIEKGSEDMKRKEKRKIRVIFILCLLVCMGDLGTESCQWEQHLANPGRTGYITCDGPHTDGILWKISIDGETDSAPLVSGDTLLILRKDSCAHLNESSLLKLNVLTGEITGRLDSEWWNPYFDMFFDGINAYVVGDEEILKADFDQQKTIAVAAIPQVCYSYPDCHALILKDRIVYPSTPLVCLSRSDFNMLWSSDLLFLDHDEVKIRSVAADSSYLYVVTEWDSTEKLHAMDIYTGTISWSRTLTDIWTIAVEGSTLYAGGENIIALDAGTGKNLWKFTPEGKVFTDLVVGPEYIFAADSQDRLYALDKTTGRMAWETGWQGTTGWAFLVGGGQFLYCASSLGEKSKLTCFRTEDGKMTWEYEFSSPIHTQPCLSEGILIVALLRGEIYAFATSTVLQETTTPETTPPESEKPPETTPPESEKPPETTPETPPESTPPSEFTSTPILVLGFLFSIGVFIVYFFIRKKH
jgi:outer membrane protein assembly factor BamB